jgi:hypothetical protein
LSGKMPAMIRKSPLAFMLMMIVAADSVQIADAAICTKSLRRAAGKIVLISVRVAIVGATFLGVDAIFLARRADYVSKKENEISGEVTVDNKLIDEETFALIEAGNWPETLTLMMTNNNARIELPPAESTESEEYNRIFKSYCTSVYKNPKPVSNTHNSCDFVISFERNKTEIEYEGKTLRARKLLIRIKENAAQFYMLDDRSLVGAEDELVEAQRHAYNSAKRKLKRTKDAVWNNSRDIFMKTKNLFSE